jgi:hypothetical protein
MIYSHDLILEILQKCHWEHPEYFSLDPEDTHTFKHYTHLIKLGYIKIRHPSLTIGRRNGFLFNDDCYFDTTWEGVKYLGECGINTLKREVNM